MYRISPLFFTMTLLSSVEVSKLELKQIKNDGTTEQVNFTPSGGRSSQDSNN